MPYSLLSWIENPSTMNENYRISLHFYLYFYYITAWTHQEQQMWVKKFCIENRFLLPFFMLFLCHLLFICIYTFSRNDALMWREKVQIFIPAWQKENESGTSEANVNALHFYMITRWKQKPRMARRSFSVFFFTCQRFYGCLRIWMGKLFFGLVCQSWKFSYCNE